MSREDPASSGRVSAGLVVLIALGFLRFAGVALDAPLLTRAGLVAAVAPLPHPIDRAPRRHAPRDFRVTLGEGSASEEISVEVPIGLHRAAIPWMRARLVCWGRAWDESTSALCRRTTRVAICDGALMPSGFRERVAGREVALWRRDGEDAPERIATLRCAQ